MTAGNKKGAPAKVKPAPMGRAAKIAAKAKQREASRHKAGEG